jgi:two-component system CheB/CheR fusion protein
MWGHEAIVVHDGPHALDIASADPPDVVFLDIALPRMDGYQVARRLRRLPGMDRALVVAISGFGHEADVLRCKEVGIDCHFLKPVEPDVLRELLESAKIKSVSPR